MISAYRKVFAVPGLRSLLAVSLLAKMPWLGVPAVLILHVVRDLGLGFGPASVTAAMWTAGVGIGAPFQGRTMDRYGLRPLFAAVMGVQAGFWGLAYLLPYPLLLVAALAAGLLTVPAFTVVRLALAVMVTEDIRHTAYVADSVTTDIAYMAGPSIGILLAAQASPTTAFLIMGGMLTLGAFGYVVANPPLRSEPAERRRARLGEWISVPMLCALGGAIAIGTAVVGFEVAALGTLQGLGQLRWSWVFLVVCGLSSIAGGLVYGGLRRPPPAILITVCLALAIVPIGVANHWLWLCVLAVPANFLVAPALSATAASVSRLAPDGSKGVAMGAYASALMVGNVAGSPVAGVAMDAAGPLASFAVVGAVSILVGGLALLAGRRTAATAGLVSSTAG